MKYTIKVWIFTVLASPILLLSSGIIINTSNLGEIIESWSLIVVMILCGLILSTPAMLLFLSIQRKLIKTLTNNKVKLILSIYSFTSVWMTFYLFDRGFVERGIQQMTWVIIYSLTIVVGVWIFKLSKPKKISI